MTTDRVPAASRRPRRRGSALLAVLWLSAALSAIAFAMSVTVRGETERAATAMDDLRSYYLASAGVERAAMELLWSATSSQKLIPQGATSIDYNFPSGLAHVEIIPDSTKLNVNRASYEALANLITALGVDPGRAGAIAGGIVARRSGGGSVPGAPSFQGPPASFQEIEELLSVTGVTPDIFYGTWSTVNGGDPSKSPLVRRLGLNDCLTVYGSLGSMPSGPIVPGTLQFNPSLFQATVAQGNAIVTFRSTARLLLPDGKLSDMQRTVGAQVRYMAAGTSMTPYHILRWYDTAWSN